MNEKSLLFRVDGEPRGKERPRFNGKTRQVFKAKKTADYEQRVKEAAFAACVRQGWHKTINGGKDKHDRLKPLRLIVCAWFPVPKSFSKRQREAARAGNLYPTVKPDADNIAKAVADGMNGVAYTDDRQLVELVVRKRYCFADRQPHVTVYLEPMPTMDEMKAAATARLPENQGGS